MENNTNEIKKEEQTLNTEEKKKKRKKIKWSTLLLLFFICVFAFSAYQLADYYINSQKEKAIYEDMQSKVGDINEMDSEEVIAEMYKTLHEENNDFYGWIKIENTNINYPVMYRPESDNFYLYRNYYKEYTGSGAIYIDDNYREGSLNMLLHGHNMKDDSMFADIHKYREEEFYLENKTLRFDTLGRKGTYEIIAAFETTLKPDSPAFFNYFEYGNITDEAEYNEYISKIKSISDYSTTATAEYGDELISMSTCVAGNSTYGRYVVVAKRISETE